MLMVAAVGFLCGVMAFSALVRWIGLLFDAPNQVRATYGHSDSRRALTLALCQSLFHAGPWSVATVGFIAYHVRSEPWAPWLFAGFGASFLLMGAVTVRFMLQLRRNSRGASDANAV
jgi:hypothetical protein